MQSSANLASLVEDHVYTVGEVCELTRLSERTVRRFIADGRIEIVRFGTNVRVEPKALRRFLHQHGRGH